MTGKGNGEQTRKVKKKNGEEESEELVELKSGDFFELPFPLQKEAGEEEEGRGRKPVRIILHWVEKTLLVDF